MKLPTNRQSVTEEIALETLKQAIENVAPDYILSATIKDANVEESDTMKAQTERCFAYELYHQWRNILNDEKYYPIKLNSEITKEIDPTYIFEDVSDDKTEKNYPDLVLHGGQNDKNSQIMICEIKRKGLHSVKERQKDFIKLWRYLNLVIKSYDGSEDSTDVRFKSAAFIMTNCSKDELESAVRSAFDDNFQGRNLFSKEDCEKIICIACDIKNEGERRIVKAYSKSLSDILQIGIKQ